MDEWKLIQKDGDTSDINTDQRVDHYWNAVFLLTSIEWPSSTTSPSGQVMPCFGPVKCRLGAQPFGERQSCNEGKIEKSRLGEQTIVGLWLLKDAVKFHDPVNCRPEKIPVTKELRKSVRFTHSAYRARLDKEKEEKRKELKETKRKTKD